MKLNLKNVLTLFRKGVRIRDGMPSAVASISLHVADSNSANYRCVGTIDRGDFLDFTPKQIKRAIFDMRGKAIRLDADRTNWLLQAQCTGDGGSRRLSID